MDRLGVNPKVSMLKPSSPPRAYLCPESPDYTRLAVTQSLTALQLFFSDRVSHVSQVGLELELLSLPAST